MSDALALYLRGVIDMSQTDAEQIVSYFQKNQVKKGDFFIKPGQISHRSYFLESGIVRSYIIDLNGNEITTRFFSAPDFFNDFLSFFRKQPSKEYYEPITDCAVRSIDHHAVQECFHSIPSFREWGRMMLTVNYATLNEHMIAFHTKTAEERYQALLSQQPRIIQEVPLKIIASYIGVTNSSLSRLRKNLSKGKMN